MAAIEETGAEYVARKGWSILRKERSSGQQQLVLRVCPLCNHEGKKRTFHIAAETGLWKTYCCDEKGNLLVLKRKLGDLDIARPAGSYVAGTSEAHRLAEKLRKARSGKHTRVPRAGLDDEYHAALLADERALEYAEVQRGLTRETIEKFKVGLMVRHGERFLAIPYYDNGTLINFKHRSLPPAEKKFEREAGCATTLYNADSLEGEWKSVVITEAELDCQAFVQYGFDCCVGVPGAATKLQDEWIERLALFDEIFLGYDCDEAGDEGADNAAEVLGRYRCRRIRLPFKDAAECMAAGIEREEFTGYVEAAVGYESSLVKPISEFSGDLKRTLKMGESAKGVTTGWVDLDAILGGLRPHELTVVTGDTGEGKSTWTVALCWNRAREGDGVLRAPFEQRPTEEVRKLVAMEAGKRFLALKEPELDAVVAKLNALPIYFVDNDGPMELAALRDAVEYGVRRYSLRLVVIDHLEFLLDKDAPDERKEIDRVVYEIKRWANKFGVHVILIVHPAKLKTSAAGKVLKPDLNDLKGSSAIKQAADNGIRIERERDVDRSKNEGRAQVVVLKCRSEFGTEDCVPMSFDRESLQYGPLQLGGKKEEKEKGKGKRGGGKKKTKEEEKETADAEPPAQGSMEV